jgi:ApaG protein
VNVRSAFRPDRSEAGKFLFTYTVRIVSDGATAARLVSRHWVITDANGGIQEVQGDGVVGHQPYLTTGEEFEYTSFCVLETPHGSMRGSYRMARDDGTSFEAEIAPFPLVVPGSLN